MPGRLQKNSPLWRELLEGMAVISAATLGAVVLYLTTGLLSSVHFTM
jgi:hypothetical protein